MRVRRFYRHDKEVFCSQDCAARGAPWIWPGDPVNVHEFVLVNRNIFVNFRYSPFFLFLPGVNDGTVEAPSLEQGMFSVIAAINSARIASFYHLRFVSST